jgi:hypothetical protein
MRHVFKRWASVGLLLAGAAFGLAACGDDPGTRAITGGLIGAGGGAAVGALAGNAGAGAVIGAGAGAITGAATTPRRDY